MLYAEHSSFRVKRMKDQCHNGSYWSGLKYDVTPERKSY